MIKSERQLRIEKQKEDADAARGVASAQRARAERKAKFQAAIKKMKHPPENPNIKKDSEIIMDMRKPSHAAVIKDELKKGSFSPTKHRESK